MLELLISSTVLILALTALRFFLRGKLNPRLPEIAVCPVAARCPAASAAGDAHEKPGERDERRPGRARRRAAADCSGKSPCPADGQYAIPGADCL